MSGITTIGRWIWLPTPGGADERLAADLPLGSGLMATLASNACHAARENGLRPLYEHPGAEVWEDLEFGTDPAGGAFPWRGKGTPPVLTGLFAVHAGVFRVRRYGETQRWPTLRLRARMASSSGSFTTGLVVCVRAQPGDPGGGRTAYVDTNSTTLQDKTVDFAIEDADVLTGNVSTASDQEGGAMGTFAVYIGGWNTSGSGASKGVVGGLVLSMEEP